MLTFFIPFLFQFTIQYTYENIDQDILIASVLTVDSNTFNNVNLRQLTFVGTTSIQTLSGINKVKIIDLPATLTSISTNGFNSFIVLSL